MMSLLEYVSDKIFKNSSDASNVKDFRAPDNIEDLLARIENVKQITEETEEPQLNKVEEEEGCFYKTGSVTCSKPDYVLIDHEYMCETKYVVPMDLIEGDQVYYLAYKKNKDDQLKIRKIIYKVEAGWDEAYDERDRPGTKSCVGEVGQESDFVDNEIGLELDTPNNSQVIKKGMNKRTVVGKVEMRKGREIYLEDNTCVNLDNVSAEFVPVIGDWVKLECLVEVDEDVANLQGEILEIEEMKPLRSLQKLGKVTEYDEESESGLIEGTIVFVKTVCLAGYIPCVGDKVVVHCIESEQRVTKRWRALEVVPMEDVSNQ